MLLTEPASFLNFQLCFKADQAAGSAVFSIDTFHKLTYNIKRGHSLKLFGVRKQNGWILNHLPKFLVFVSIFFYICMQMKAGYTTG